MAGRRMTFRLGQPGVRSEGVTPLLEVFLNRASLLDKEAQRGVNHGQVEALIFYFQRMAEEFPV